MEWSRPMCDSNKSPLLADPENSQDTTLLELNYQLFEDNQESSTVMTPMNNEGTRAKEAGNKYFKEQKFEEAIVCYSRSIVELPTAAAYGNRAMAYIQLNKFIEAENDCTEALKIDGHFFKAYARRAMARTKLGCDLEGALADIQAAMRLDSNNREMEELYAEIVSMKGATEAKEEGNAFFKDRKFKDAIVSYSASIRKFPTAVAYNNRAVAYLKLNKWKEAENDCSKALKIDDQYFKAYARRAIARSKLGCNLGGALGDVEVALKLEPDNQEMKELQGKLIQMLRQEGEFL
ncbi:hsp70-Hsp90 organizing protein 1-like [Silene latifolia]|uniref:hsp70-Hsp90 organizing protein 1-like n=1 Tax=Silene latifolia TaxID=37657 RepID=UPI003D77188F